MKKILLLSLSALLLPACADKNQYEQAVLEEMKKETDINDYKIPPEHMAKCVVDTSAQNMPGVFALDPERLKSYRSYAKMLTLSKAEDPKKVLEELRTDFGSAKDLAEARANYSESVMECYTAVISESEKAQKEKAEDEKSDAETVKTEDVKVEEQQKTEAVKEAPAK